MRDEWHQRVECAFMDFKNMRAQCEHTFSKDVRGIIANHGDEFSNCTCASMDADEKDVWTEERVNKTTSNDVRQWQK
eukprot:3194489-Lingulodinium_polyedra.AAC.1